MRLPDICFKRTLLPAALLFSLMACPIQMLRGATPASYKQHVLPLLRKFCFKCHNAKKQEGKVRLDNLDPDLIGGKDAQRWHHALDMINQGDMPPKDAKRPSPQALELMTSWIQRELVKSIKAHRATNRAILRRMTRQQYTHTLQQLLKLDLKFGDALPKDAKSKSGFLNNANVLRTTPLHLDYYQKIAREALRQTIFIKKPKVVRYRVKIGSDIGRELPGDKRAGRFGGYVSQPVDSRHLIADVLDAKSQPMIVAPRPGRYGRTLRNLGIDMRGSSRERYSISEQGMLLDSGLPHVEKAPGSWHGPSPNLKMLIRRDFPVKGPFAFRVSAARVASRLRQLPKTYRANKPVVQIQGEKAVSQPGAIVLRGAAAAKLIGLVVKDGRLTRKKKARKKRNRHRAEFRFSVKPSNLYQIDVVRGPLNKGKKSALNIQMTDRQIKFNKRIRDRSKDNQAVIVDAIGIAFLKKGNQTLSLRWNGQCDVESVVITPLPKDHRIRQQRDKQIAQARLASAGAAARTPVLQVSLGNRTDDGQDAQRFAGLQEMTEPFGKFKTFQFVGRLENVPTPQLDLNELTSLSNIMVLTVWNGDFVKNGKQAGSRIVVREMEFEAPYYPQWPPPSHRRVFFASANQKNPPVYAREILARFMKRAFRRPLRNGELDLYYRFWLAVRHQYSTFEEGIRETLVAVLCSPKFIYLAEANQKKKTRQQREYELASKLSYFLWNGPPDKRLLKLAAQKKLQAQLRQQVRRLIKDKKSWRFVKAFCNQWLKLNRHHEMQVDIRRFPSFTRFVKEDMSKETYHFVNRVMRENLDVATLIASDFVMVNQNLAEFYGIQGVVGTHFRPVTVPASMKRGGLLTQGSFLSGHSDGKQAHPIKRAVWLMERILGDSPPPPPPNVPDLNPQDPKNKRLSIAKQLALHRDSVSCRNCHKKLDPYGLVFEDYNGAGLIDTKAGKNPDTKVTLPDGTVVNGVAGMKSYILKSRREKFTASLVEHLMTFALGRDMSFVDEQEIRQLVKRIDAAGNRFQTVLEEIIVSRMFLE